MPGKPRPAQDSLSCAGRPAGEVTTYSKVVDRHEHLRTKGFLDLFGHILFYNFSIVIGTPALLILLAIKLHRIEST